MKRRKNTTEIKNLATLLCEARDLETLGSVGELILSLALPNLGEGEQEIISDAEIGEASTPIVNLIRFYVWNPKGRAQALHAFATELARLFSSFPKIYVIHAKYAMGGIYVEVVCRKVAATHASWKRYMKMFSHGMQIYSGQKQNPKRRRNSQESDALTELICSSSRPTLMQAKELIEVLWGGNTNSIIESWTMGHEGVWFRFNNRKDAYDMFTHYSKFFALNMKIAIVLEKDPRKRTEYTVYFLCWSPTNPTMQWIASKARKGHLDLHIGGKAMFSPPKRKNSGQYARQLGEILCGGEAPSALELIKSLYDADWDNILTQALKARKELRFDFHHDMTDLSAVQPFVQYWKQYFANDPRVYVFAHPLQHKTHKGTRVYITCSVHKIGPIRIGPMRRKNSGHLPPTSLGKKLEPLLCSKDDATLDQFGELIRSFFPDIHTFTHWGNLSGSGDIDFDFSKVSKADEFEKWAKKAFSKNIDIWRPMFDTVGLICRGQTIPNPKRRRNTKGRDLGYGTNNGSMVKNQLKSIHRIAKELDDALYGADRLPDWVQSKVTVALDRLVVAQNYLLSKLEGYKSNPKCNVNSAITDGKKACKLIRANKGMK